MRRRTENKIVLVVRRTRLDELVARFNTEDQARFYVEHLGADFSDYLAEDSTYKQAVRQAEDILSGHGRLQVVDRAFVPNFIFGPRDTVVALGQDGLVANVMKYLDGHLLIGANPGPGPVGGGPASVRRPRSGSADARRVRLQASGTPRHHGPGHPQHRRNPCAA